MIITRLAQQQKSQLHYFTLNLSIPGITGFKRHQKRWAGRKLGRLTYTSSYHMDSHQSRPRSAPELPSETRVPGAAGCPTPEHSSEVRARLGVYRTTRPQAPGVSSNREGCGLLPRGGRPSQAPAGPVPAREAPSQERNRTAVQGGCRAEGAVHAPRQSAPNPLAGSELAQSHT